MMEPKDRIKSCNWNIAHVTHSSGVITPSSQILARQISRFHQITFADLHVRYYECTPEIYIQSQDSSRFQRSTS
jgi:hypothetical protein